MARPTQSALVARRVGVTRLGFYAHRRYIERHGMPTSFDELRGYTRIGFDRNAAILKMIENAGLPITRDDITLRSDDDRAQLASLRAGYGIGACHAGIAARDPDLVRVLPDFTILEFEIWVAMHEDLRASRRVRLLFDHLV